MGMLRIGDVLPRGTAAPISSGSIGYLGGSLGGIIGTVAVAMEPDINAAVLNAGGVGLVDVIEKPFDPDYLLEKVKGKLEEKTLAY